MFLKFKLLNQDLVQQCYALNNAADEARPRHHSAAIAIQSWWRGYLIRQEFKRLHRSATLIQGLFRGFRERRIYRKFVELTVKEMRAHFYHTQATKIQAVFRGYRSRKNVHNFYARKRYLEMVRLQNDVVRDHLTKYKRASDQEKEKLKAIEDEKQIIYQARKTHYLLSTTQVSGVYDPRVKNGKSREPMESMLRAVKPLGSIERKQKLPSIGIKRTITAQQRRMMENARTMTQPQGPFKTTREIVLENRFRPMNPSLRVSEPYETHIEEARQQLRFDDMMKRIKAERFMPVMKCQQERYQQLLHTTSGYGHVDYGNKHFRSYESDHDFQDRPIRETSSIGDSGRLVASGNARLRFANVVSPIPFFDQYMDDKKRSKELKLGTM